VVPTFQVNQFDLGDVFLSPCRAGTFSADHSGVCHDCSTCGQEQFATAECKPIQDTTCQNCTECTDRQMEVCPCGNTTDTCYLGDRVCLPLVSMTVNLSFSVTAAKPLNILQQRFLQQAMGTGFIVFLAGYIPLPIENIQLLGVTVRSLQSFGVTYILSDVYRPEALGRLRGMSDAVIQSGLADTFGVNSNTFATRRRLLATGILLTTSDSAVSCAATTDCGPFFLSVPGNQSCTVDCVAQPCPPGFVGDFGRCSPCLNATFKPTTGTDGCTACPVGFTSDMAAVSVGDCRPLPATVVTTSRPTTTTSRPTTTSAGPTSSQQASTSRQQASTSPVPTSSQLVTTSPGVTSSQPATTSPGITSSQPATTSQASNPITSPPPAPQQTTAAGSPSGVPSGPPSGGQSVQYTQIVELESTIIINEGTDWGALLLCLLILGAWGMGARWLWQGLASPRPADQGYVLIPQEPEDRRVIRLAIPVRSA